MLHVPRLFMNSTKPTNGFPSRSTRKTIPKKLEPISNKIGSNVSLTKYKVLVSKREIMAAAAEKRLAVQKAQAEVKQY